MAHCQNLMIWAVPVQGALWGAKTLAIGVAPMPLAAVFTTFTRTDSPFPYLPGAKTM